VTVEELSAHDGLHNLGLRACVGLDGIRVAQLAVEDFVYGYGTYEELCAKAGLTPETIVNASLRLLPAASHAA
jgi:transketolase